MQDNTEISHVDTHEPEKISYSLANIFSIFEWVVYGIINFKQFTFKIYHSA